MKSAIVKEIWEISILRHESSMQMKYYIPLSINQRNYKYNSIIKASGMTHHS